MFVVGLVLSAIAFGTSLAWRHEEDVSGWRFAWLGGAVAYFGMGVIAWIRGVFRPRPRIVPCFERQLAPHGQGTSRAFERGRALYRDMVALDRLAQELGVTPLSNFGFADDAYGQDLQLHPAADGLRSVEAIRGRLAGAAADLEKDLRELEAVLRVAADRAAGFSLMLRVGDDSLQAVMTREPRQGSFW